MDGLCTEPHCVNICTVTVNYFEMRMRIHRYKRFLCPWGQLHWEYNEWYQHQITYLTKCNVSAI